MKHVWVKSATCAVTRSMTRGAALPTVVTAMPEPKSMSWLPDVDEDAAAGTLDVDGQAGGDTGRHGGRLAGLERGRLRAGDRGLQEPLLGDVAHGGQYAVRRRCRGTRPRACELRNPSSPRASSWAYRRVVSCTPLNV